MGFPKLKIALHEVQTIHLKITNSLESDTPVIRKCLSQKKAKEYCCYMSSDMIGQESRYVYSRLYTRSRI